MTGFVDKYFDMLSAGGTKHHRNCWLHSASMPPIRPSGSKGLGVIEGLIDELEALDAAGA